MGTTDVHFSKLAANGNEDRNFFCLLSKIILYLSIWTWNAIIIRVQPNWYKAALSP